MRRFIFPLLILCTVACGRPAVYESYQEIPEEKWNRYNAVEFDVHIPDSGRYDISLCLRHTTDYEMANLWCFFSLRGGHAFGRKDTVNLKVAEADGRWLGKGGSVKVLEQQIYPQPVVLPEGKLIVRVEQGMRFEEMKGVKDIGIRIEKAE